ncbi:MAG TPA: tetratricopeptide repeat protein [Myxococcota bacterium]|nr:tetratricopeptide repeat protein [Myxococcota bacterium]HQK51393.1 tetratricopeptide repeat protein [Myxococcota bacterium]
MRRTWVSLLLVIHPGCVTLWTFNETVDDLRGRLQALEEKQKALEATQAEAQQQMGQVRQEMVEATEALRAGGANLGADVDGLKTEVARLKGSQEEVAWAVSRQQEDLQEVRKALDALGVPVVKLPDGVTEDRDSLFRAAQEAIQKKDGPLARGLLRRFLETFPDEPRAPEAQFLVGETFFQEGKWGQAVKEYQRVHDRYKDVRGAPVARALERIAESLLKQGDCQKALGVYQYLVDLARKGPEVDRARSQIQRLKRTCKGTR